jgi:hypothetical protein
MFDPEIPILENQVLNVPVLVGQSGTTRRLGPQLLEEAFFGIT